ncbi:hypothetical protein J3Q64DRAFT_1732118 [Phycomyces blakesleeanus]|uniref:Uncharacterized protein n=2 Tax=Phycomyces blakesleeanus TaxID=4837 RepID=A0A162U9L8_PHYB8|nr:hypothetical protein PHYBLDRAFT_181266 [Phycomyces blakesleeanus NRRL 1555(-)]OAD74602.1 hypothetical protein PHYBLDRAFT_181266 [Phycomyces blakesleeanus NRRL 1555(-)]|eukprot:XP_018292642.1 hypothetical protein PHYBLDRAFT_181266 [Phycomyces blakesleeanus NRRL 1555(-)]
MIDIPSSYIVSSKLSPLEPQDVLRVLRLVQSEWNDECVKDRMNRHPTPLIAVGIANPHDLQRVVRVGVPVIHLDRECRALKAAQARYLRELKYGQILASVGSAVLSGVLVARGLKQMNGRSLRALLSKKSWFWMYFGGAGLIWIGQVSLMRALKESYGLVTLQDECFMVRRDLVVNKWRSVLQRWLPYCLLVGSVFRWTRVYSKKGVVY